MKRKAILTLRTGTVYAVLIALMPIIRAYKIPFIELGMGTGLIVIMMPFAGIILFNNLNNICFKMTLPICIYCLWSLIRCNGDITTILLSIAISVHILAISTGYLDAVALKKTIIFISILAAGALALQIIVHGLFSIHIPMMNVDLLINGGESYRQTILTGYSDDGYRPSAFFLEPSHVTQYCFIGIVLCLFDESSRDIKKAVWISMGILLTTSGMGIGVVAGIWILYFLLNLKNYSWSEKVNLLVLYSFLFILAIFVALQIPSVQLAIARITGSGNSNAFTGRLLYWDVYIPTLKGITLIIGNGAATIPDNIYFTGLMTLLYEEGIVGAALYYIILFKLLKCNCISVKIIALILGILLVFANTTGFIFIIFYFGILITLILDMTRNTQPILDNC